MSPVAAQACQDRAQNRHEIGQGCYVCPPIPIPHAPSSNSQGTMPVPAHSKHEFAGSGPSSSALAGPAAAAAAQHAGSTMSTWRLLMSTSCRGRGCCAATPSSGGWLPSAPSACCGRAAGGKTQRGTPKRDAWTSNSTKCRQRRGERAGGLTLAHHAHGAHAPAAGAPSTRLRHRGRVATRGGGQLLLAHPQGCGAAERDWHRANHALP